MRQLFHSVSEQEALNELPRLQQRLTAKARPSSFLYRRSEGKSLLSPSAAVIALAPAVSPPQPEDLPMSDAIKIASQAPKVIEGLLAEMFAARAEDNRIALGELYSGNEYIQVQLVVTSKPADLLDDDLVMGDEA